MKITGTKSYIQIEEENGNVARFDGEACLGEFYAYASPVRWVRHRGETTDGDRIYLAFCVGSLIFASPFLFCGIWMQKKSSPDGAKLQVNYQSGKGNRQSVEFHKQGMLTCSHQSKGVNTYETTDIWNDDRSASKGTGNDPA